MCNCNAAATDRNDTELMMMMMMLYYSWLSSSFSRPSGCGSRMALPFYRKHKSKLVQLPNRTPYYVQM
jgi:hypothetical protein